MFNSLFKTLNIGLSISVIIKTNFEKLTPSNTISIIFPTIKMAIAEYKPISISPKKNTFKNTTTVSIPFNNLAVGIFELYTLNKETIKSVPPVDA